MAIPITRATIESARIETEPSSHPASADGSGRLPEHVHAIVESFSDERMPALLFRFRSDRDCLDRCLGVAFSQRRRERLRAFFTEWQGILEEIPFTNLERNDRADWLLFRSLLEAEIRRLDRDERRFANAGPLLGFAAGLIALDDARLAMEDIDPKAAAATLARAQGQIKEVTEALESGALDLCAGAAGYTVAAIAKLRTMLETWFNFYSGYDPAFTWWVPKTYRGLDKCLEEFAAFLRTKAGRSDANVADTDVILGEPIGRTAVVNELRYSQIPYEPEELIEAAAHELEWCQAQLRLAARELGYGQDWHAALEQVKSEHVAPGEQPALVRDLAREAVGYVRGNDLITVPPLAEECWRIEMISAERQKINPFFWGGESMGVSFPTCEMEYDDKQMSLRGNNRAFARATVHHELIPGHRLQAFFQERYRPYRRIFYTPFWTEGWTLHWEMLLWEHGFARTPQEKIGMLFWRQHRCARVIFSLKFHLGQMTAAECIEMLVTEVGHEPQNARAEVRRSVEGRFDPLYQAAYLIGAMQVHALYRELVGTGRMTDREFHDSVLEQNCMPIAMLRAVLTGAPLERDYHADWRFLDHWHGK